MPENTGKHIISNIGGVLQGHYVIEEEEQRLPAEGLAKGVISRAQ